MGTGKRLASLGGACAAQQTQDAARQPDVAIAEALCLLHEPGAVYEVRILNTERAGTVSGYFSDSDAAVAEIARWDGRASGVYLTMNPVDGALLARAANRLKTRARATTGDRDITRRRWLLIDIDYDRPAGISATDAEVAAALRTAHAIETERRSHGWPDPIVASSGNGAHLFYRIDLANDEAARGLVERCLAALGDRFDEDGGVHIDRKVFNAARIVKVPGTMACKGDDTPERPHRRSGLVRIPNEIKPVPRGLLEAIGGRVANPPAEWPKGGTGSGTFDLETFLAGNRIDLRRHKEEAGADTWEMAVCPFNAEHDHGEAWIRREASGALSAGCHHNSCTWTWADLRARYEPEYQRRQNGGQLQAARSPADEPDPIPESGNVFIDWPTFWERDHNEAEWVYPDVLARGRGHAEVATPSS